VFAKWAPPYDIPQLRIKVAKERVRKGKPLVGSHEHVPIIDHQVPSLDLALLLP
jgi:hypothetical protein